MDPFTHATLGAVAALNRKRIRPNNSHLIYPAIICGALAGMFPDIDVLIRSAEQPLLSLEYHRHFTHSLIFVPFGALIVSWLLSITFLRKLPFREIYAWCFVGMACHGVLDAMTNYGTHLFWPFTDRRENWSIISIIDPLFTLPLLACVVLCCIKRSTNPAYYALLYALVYWSFGAYQQREVTALLHETAKQRGHQIEKIEVKPSLGNLLAWRGQYIYNGNIYVDAYHTSPLTDSVTYTGSSFPLFQPTEEFLKSIGAVQAKEIEYFSFFSDGWVAHYPPGSHIIADMRFSTLPNSLQPLWGIELYPGEKTRHIRRVNTRKREDGDVMQLWNMIHGEK